MTLFELPIWRELLPYARIADLHGVSARCRRSASVELVALPVVRCTSTAAVVHGNAHLPRRNHQEGRAMTITSYRVKERCNGCHGSDRIVEFKIQPTDSGGQLIRFCYACRAALRLALEDELRADFDHHAMWLVACAEDDEPCKATGYNTVPCTCGDHRWRAPDATRKKATRTRKKAIKKGIGPKASKMSERTRTR